jgi:ribose transport system permease protein
MRRLLTTDWFGLAVLVLVLVAVLGALRPDFLSSFNQFVLLDSIALSILIALSQMVVIALGQMNLSVGAIGGLVAIGFSGAMQVWGVPPALALAGGLLLGGLCGACNGLLTARAGLSAFVVTLGTMAAFKGINLGITQAQPFYNIPAVVKAAGNAGIGPVPVLLLPSLAVAALVGWMLARLPIGRQILAVGGNPHAAATSGIAAARVVLVTHILSGVLAGAAGMLAVARLQLGQPTIGDDWLIPSFAAPVIGGTVLAGGHASVAGTVLGVALVAVIGQALVLFRVDPYFVQLLLGLLILAAVGFSRARSLRLRAA